MTVKINIITCPQWGARKPKGPPVMVGAAAGIIFHHTAGHHAEISQPANESVGEAMRYARDIQRFHMDSNGWNDSGHNFLVCRNGSILQGRWITVSAIEAGHMVISAHCPGFNEWVGIEHEHAGQEAMTTKQFNSSARLQAWIAAQYGRITPLPVDPHSKHFATACPANLAGDIADIRRAALDILTVAYERTLGR